MKFTGDEAFDKDMERQIFGLFLQLREYFSVQAENPESGSLKIRMGAIKRTTEHIDSELNRKYAELQSGKIIPFPKKQQ